MSSFDTITWITDFVDRVGELIIGQFKFKKDSPQKNNIRLFIEAFGNQVQKFEDAAKLLAETRYLDSAIGIQLDILGDVLAEDRKSLSDEDYRKRLKFKVFVHSSHGEASVLFSAVKEVTESTMVYMLEPGLATFIVTFDGAIIPVDLSSLVSTVKAAGTEVLLHATGGETPFGFGTLDGIGEDDPNALGFSELGDSPLTGGSFTENISS